MTEQFTADMVTPEMAEAYYESRHCGSGESQVNIAAAINASPLWAEYKRLRAENEARRWKPIETAPHDKRILIWSGQEIYAAHWGQNPITGDEAWIVAEWGDDGDQALVKPTHWQLAPEPMEKCNG